MLIKLESYLIPVVLNLFSTTPLLSNCPLFQAPLTSAGLR